jgi:hypothetical protein
MKKTPLLLVAVATACVLVVPAARSASRSREETVSYLKPAGVWTSHYDAPARALPEDDFVFIPKKGERYVRFDFTDALGTDVLFHVTLEGESVEDHGLDHAYSDGMIDCAPSYEMALTSLTPIHVSVYSGLCPNHTFGFASTGTITASFRR